MELRQLRYFVRTAETLNFSEAAKSLYVTQSTLSQQIRQLEQELDTVLFLRDSHSVMLSEAGERLLPYARQTLQSAESCLDHVRDLKNMLSGSLNIGITYSFAPILKETVKEFLKLHPNVKLNIWYRTMEELMMMLRRKELDFVLAFKPFVQYPEIESHILFDNHLSVIVSRNHPLAGKDSVTLSDILPYSIAMPSKGMQARNAFDRFYPGAFAGMNVRVELNDVNTILELVRGSGLIAILSDATIHQTSGLEAIPIEVPHNQMEGCVHTHVKTYRKRSAEEFIRILNDSEAVRERASGWLK